MEQGKAAEATDRAEPDVEAWAAVGLTALERYLARHAAFDRWCDEHRRRYGADPGARAVSEGERGA